jgi:hypothetical protein
MRYPSGGRVGSVDGSDEETVNAVASRQAHTWAARRVYLVVRSTRLGRLPAIALLGLVPMVAATVPIARGEADRSTKRGVTAGLGPWSISVSVTPTAVGPIAVRVANVRIAGPRDERRLRADLRFRNGAKRRATFTDHFRHSAFATGGTNDQLLVADEGCGYGVDDPGDPVEPGFCFLYLDALELKPGRSGVRALTAYQGLAGMTPLGPGHYEFERRVKFRFEGGSRRTVRRNLTVGFDVAAR